MDSLIRPTFLKTHCEIAVPDLIAEGGNSSDQRRLEVRGGRSYVLGRDAAVDLSVTWDAHVSRRHVELNWLDERLRVRKLPDANNPLYFAGKEVESCDVRVGEHFVIGGTSFLLAESGQTPSPPSASPVEEVTFSREALEHVRFRDPDRRIEVLSHLPQLIWGARTDAELHLRLVNLLLAGITRAEAAAIVGVDPNGTPHVLHGDRRHETAGTFRPSSRLIAEAIMRRKQNVLHVWETASADRGAEQQEFTATQEFDWAFCTPIPGPPMERMGLYLAGRFDVGWAAPTKPNVLDGADPTNDGGRSPPYENHQLQADVKFAELVAEIVGAVRKLNQLERQQAGLRQFFPPVILSALEDDADLSLLAPRETDVVVMFCDLRGFSRQAEVSRDDLTGLLDRVSRALGVVTQHILEHGGVIGDFQGDAAMGFWGWPVAAEDAPLRACRAALGIRAALAATAAQPGHPLADFEMGIGMARGKAVAGKIGTHDHVKVTVFGPVVNLASRLEGMTKQLRVPILLDDSLAAIVRERLPAEEGRLRRLAQVLPFGMETPVLVSELLPSETSAPELTAAHLSAYETAVSQFIAGKWEEAYRALRTLPPSDRAQDFLALLIAQHNRIAPADWTGVVRLPSK